MTITQTRVSLGGIDLSAEACDVATAAGLSARDVQADLAQLISGVTTEARLLDDYLDGADPGYTQGWRDYVDDLSRALCDRRQLAAHFAREKARKDYCANRVGAMRPELDADVDAIWSDEYDADLARYLECDVAQLTEAELEAAHKHYAAALVFLRSHS